MLDHPDLPELEEIGLALMASLLQHKDGVQSDDELLTNYDSLLDDLTIDDLQWLVIIFASLSIEVLQEWAQAIGSSPEELLTRIALLKAVERLKTS